MIGNIAIIAIGIAAAGAALGDGIIVQSFLSASARQPEMEAHLFSRMIIGIAFVEATFFIALAMSFVIK